MVVYRRLKLTKIMVSICLLTAIVLLILYSLSTNINLFFTPNSLSAEQVGREIKLGGMVMHNSIERGDGLRVNFVVTDYEKSIEVSYRGILPDLFKEGQGVVAIGKLSQDNIFIANKILAKHDENYMPKELYETLAKNDSSQIPTKG